MASQNIGSIHYDVGLKTGQFDAAAAGVNAKVAGMGDKFSAVGNVVSAFAKTTAVAMGAAAVAVGTLATKMLMSGAELEQQLGGAEAVFGEFADGIKEKAKDAYFTAGLSQTEFLQGANKMGSLFQGAGFSVQQSMNMSAESMQRASDIASIMGISTTEALEAVSGMAKGNFTMMDNLGVAMNDTAIGAYALSKGINKSTAEMSIQEKVGLAQQMFMEKTAKYAGNYAKENQTLAGSLNSTKKAFDNLMSGQGEIDGFIELLINTLEIAVPQIVKILPQIVTGFAEVLKAFVYIMPKILPELIPAFINAIVGLLEAVVAALPSVIDIILKAMPLIIDSFIKLFLAILQALPKIIETIANAMPTIINALVDGLTKPEALTAIILGAVQLFLAIIKALPIIIQALIKALPVIIENIKSTLTSAPFLNGMKSAAVDLMKAMINGFIGNVNAVRNAIGNIGGNILGAIGGFIGNVYNAGKSIIEGLGRGIRDAASGAINAAKDVLGKVRRLFPSSPAKEGAFSGRGWTTYSGRAIMAGLGDGIIKGSRSAIDSTSRAMATIGSQLSAQSQIDMMVSAGSRGSMTAAGAGMLGGQTAVNTYVYGDTILNGETDQRAYLDRLAQNFVKVSEGAAT